MNRAIFDKILEILKSINWFVIILLILLAFIIKLPFGLHSFEKDKCGYKNFCGFTIINPQYDECGGFYNGVALVKEHHSNYGVSSYEEILEEITAKEEGRTVKQLEPKWTYYTSKKCINIHNEEVPMANCK